MPSAEHAQKYDFRTDGTVRDDTEYCVGCVIFQSRNTSKIMSWVHMIYIDLSEIFSWLG